MTDSSSAKPKANRSFEKGFFWGIVAVFVCFYVVMVVDDWFPNKESKIDYVHIVNSDKDVKQVSRGKACSIKLGCELDAVIFLGEINDRSVEMLKDVINAKQSKWVCFNSFGGNTKAALDLSKFIKDERINTCLADYYEVDDAEVPIVNTECSSACNQAFLSAEKRLKIGNTAKFSGHAYATKDSLRIDFLFIDWLIMTTRIKDNSDFFEAIYYANTPDRASHEEYARKVSNISHHDRMYSLSLKKMNHYKIFTETCFDGLASCQTFAKGQQRVNGIGLEKNTSNM
ncbi:hypothetical protein [Neptuniibacter sp. QD57_21]|uniref:hypothetical protein n=1 Tax=Neptuniibacter sp. QD57_21 TaxID=3398213 RepID=UPI0039F5C21E